MNLPSSTTLSKELRHSRVKGHGQESLKTEDCPNTQNQENDHKQALT